MPYYDLNTLLSINHRLSTQTKRDIFGIAYIEKQTFEFEKINSEYYLVKYNNCSEKTPFIQYKIGHGFMYDEWLRRYLNKPISFLKKMGHCKAWITPDISIDMNASKAQAIGIIENIRWIGRFGQEMGQIVFPSVGWSREELDDICFAGLRDGSIFFISTLGVNNSQCITNFFRGYKEMRKRFPNSKIVCLGKQIEGMDNDIIYVDYDESFGYSSNLQFKLFTSLEELKGEINYGK